MRRKEIAAIFVWANFKSKRSKMKESARERMGYKERERDANKRNITETLRAALPAEWVGGG